MMENVFETFCTERNIKTETIKGYRGTINKYTQYYQMTIEELLQEAIDEEDSNIKKRSRKLKGRLIQFRTHLSTETKLADGTVRNHMKNLQTFYTHFDIEYPQLPPLQTNERVETTYYDLPTKKQIKLAVETAGTRVGSLILFMASSGTGRTECTNMTIRDFTDACSQYYTSETLPEIIDELDNTLEEIVPTFYLLRQKTNKKYYTFCTPEAANLIIEWLKLKQIMAEQNEEELDFDDSLWDLTNRQVAYHFSNINDELGFGFKGPYRFFRPHTMRKFHASNIGLSQENIDLLQGRSRDSVHEAYIKTNPENFKKVYMGVMENVTINKKIKEIHHDEFTININIMIMGSDYGINL